MSHPASGRPLSPHLQIYKPMLTMMMSITHRITGTGLYFGMAGFAFWLLAAATSPDLFATFNNFLSSWLGRLIMIGFTWAMLHHALGGIRHLIWDLGYGFEHPMREWLARLNLVGSIGLTALVWFLACNVI